MKRVIGTVLLALLLTGVLAVPATADGAETSTYVTPISGINTCNGESLEGTAVVHTTIRIDIVNGIEHFMVTTHLARIKAVSETGTVYTGTFRPATFRFKRSLDSGEIIVMTAVKIGVLVSKGSADNELLRFTSHFTINANGELTVDYVRYSIECRG